MSKPFIIILAAIAVVVLAVGIPIFIRARSTSASNLCMTKTLLIFFGGFVMLSFGLWLGFREQAFLRSCETTTGKASSKPVERRFYVNHAEQIKYSFHYTFTVGQKTYEGWTDAADDPSETVTVYYDRTNPAESRIGEPEPTIGWKLAGLGFACTFIGGFCYYRENIRAA